MVRCHLLAISLTVFLGCQSELPELPVEYYISSSCLPQNTDNPDVAIQKRDEFQAIIDGADAWSEATCVEVFRYMGVYDDDWFTIAKDLQDGKRVVYCLDDYENADVNKIEEESPVRFVAYSIADIFVKRLKVREIAYQKNVEVYHRPSVPSNADYMEMFRIVATHEFGHQIGFGHHGAERGYSVMSPHLASEMAADSPTLLDIKGSSEVDGFCDWYDCPPASTCPTSPVF